MMSGWIHGKEQPLPNDILCLQLVPEADHPRPPRIRHDLHGHVHVQDPSHAPRRTPLPVLGHTQYRKRLPGLHHGHGLVRDPSLVPDQVQLHRRVSIPAHRAAKV